MSTASCINLLSSDVVRNPCAMVAPKGDSARARSGSVWIQYWSPVISAKRSIISCVMVCQLLTPISLPTDARISSSCMRSCPGKHFPFAHVRDNRARAAIQNNCQQQREHRDDEHRQLQADGAERFRYSC